jgi:NTE family protein
MHSIKDKGVSDQENYSSKVKNTENRPQRALVFQGGGALGAYEAGVFKVLYNWIKEETQDDENIFDIVAGTSIGAINATIVMSHYLERKEQLIQNGERIVTLKCWEGAPKKLLHFWKYISSFPNLYRDWLLNLNLCWLQWFQMNPYIHLPSREAFRRYLSTRVSLVFGEPPVFLPSFFAPFPTEFNNKFLDFTPQFAWWYRYTSQPLRESIEMFATKLSDGGIKTSIENYEPRLILISVDIEEGATVSFDSYEKPKDRTLKSEYNVHDVENHDRTYEKSIFYENGITTDHVMASASVPKNFDYVEIKGSKFWDGGLLSNTPLREVISEHNLFWKEKLGLDSVELSFDTWSEPRRSIPSLGVCIVNLYPSKETTSVSALKDYDMIKDRENDIKYHDKTEYDLKVATFVSDYVAFVTEMTDLAFQLIKEKDNPADKKDKFDTILKKQAKSRLRSGKKREYQDLLKNRFEISSVIKIERQDDEDTISDKALDFSASTVSNLITSGIKDALIEIISKLSDDINNLEMRALLCEMKKDLISIKVPYDSGAISAVPISNYRKKIDACRKQLNDEQYNALIRSVNIITSSLELE